MDSRNQESVGGDARIDRAFLQTIIRQSVHMPVAKHSKRFAPAESANRTIACGVRAVSVRLFNGWLPQRLP
jgi:hypothetical protein